MTIFRFIYINFKYINKYIRKFFIRYKFVINIVKTLKYIDIYI